MKRSVVVKRLKKSKNHLHFTDNIELLYFRYPVGLGPSIVMAEDSYADYGLLDVEAGDGWNLTRNISAVTDTLDNVSLAVEDTRLCNLRDFQVV